MALKFSSVDSWDKTKRIHVTGTAAASGNDSTGGDTLDLSQVPLIASAQKPNGGIAWRWMAAWSTTLTFSFATGDECEQSPNRSPGRGPGGGRAVGRCTLIACGHCQ
jgi:hypothetical protein